MDDKRFKVGSVEIVIRKETWEALKIVGSVFAIALSILALICLICFYEAKTTEIEKNINTQIDSFIEDCSTITIDEGSTIATYKQGKLVSREAKN